MKGIFTEAIKTAWDFFQNEILGMGWLKRLISTILNACGLDIESRIGGSIQFFIYDTIKIMILLGFLILIISYIQSYFPPERTKKILGRFHGIWANIIAALLGTVTPFCSCSSDRGFPHRELFIPQSGFLQTPPHDGRPCLRLTVPTVKPVVDFHHQVIMRAKHTKK